MSVPARVICITPDAMITDQQIERYGPRYSYVTETLIPLLLSNGLDASIFPAITPKDIETTDDEIRLLGRTFRRGRMREGHLAPPSSVSLSLGHYLLWKDAVESNRSVLILEDDAASNHASLDVVMNAIHNFSQIKSPSILYLQSSCPWRAGNPPKEYHPSFLRETEHGLLLLSSSWYDLSGTAAYMVNPEGAKVLAGIMETRPVWAVDGMIHDAVKMSSISVFLPKNHQNNFTLIS